MRQRQPPHPNSDRGDAYERQTFPCANSGCEIERSSDQEGDPHKQGSCEGRGRLLGNVQQPTGALLRCSQEPDVGRHVAPEEGVALMLEVVACQSCAGPTTFTTEMQPLGAEPGHRVYFCESCKRYTWMTWRITQQQQQSQKKPATDETE
jgi:hypothetical protein